MMGISVLNAAKFGYVIYKIVLSNKYVRDQLFTIL